VRIGEAYAGMTQPVDHVAMEMLIREGGALRVSERLDEIVLALHNERCPCTLPGGAKRHWVIDAEIVAERVRQLAQEGKPAGLSAVVNFGGGRSADSRQNVSPAAIGML
jgi:glycerol dehydrogenase-like iron-containing ADH family enzyme